MLLVLVLVVLVLLPYGGCCFRQIVYTGKARLVCDDVNITLLGDGDTVGEPAAILQCTASATTVALTPCHVIAVPVWAYQRFWEPFSVWKKRITTLTNSSPFHLARAKVRALFLL